MALIDTLGDSGLRVLHSGQESDTKTASFFTQYDKQNPGCSINDAVLGLNQFGRLLGIQTSVAPDSEHQLSTNMRLNKFSQKEINMFMDHAKTISKKQSIQNIA